MTMVENILSLWEMAKIYNEQRGAININTLTSIGVSRLGVRSVTVNSYVRTLAGSGLIVKGKRYYLKIDGNGNYVAKTDEI